LKAKVNLFGAICAFVLAPIFIMGCASLAGLRKPPVPGFPAVNSIEDALPQTTVHDLALAHMAQGGDRIPKVLVIGLDGTRPDALMPAGIQDFLDKELPGAKPEYAFAGGVPGGYLQRTMTGPGFTSILTGTWADKHGVVGNLIVDKSPAVMSFPAEVVARWPGKRAAVLAAWEAIVDGSTHGDKGIFRFVPGQGYYFGDYATKDPAVMAESARCIADGYDLVFAVIDLPDHIGHQSGFSPDNAEYVTAIHKALAQAATLVEAVKARPGYADEDWLVILTTDHGGTGKNHGGQSAEERSTFIIEWDSAGT
jgi:hypothetical protein